MAILTDSILLDVFALFTSLIVIFVGLCFRSLGYWQRKGVKCPDPTFPFGNSSGLVFQKDASNIFIQKMYQFHRNSHKEPCGGIYLFCSPQFMPIDPELVKHIMQNNFSHFYDRGVYVNEADDPLSAHLFALEGQKWKNLRAKLTPTFTSGKMRMMLDMLVKCSEDMTLEMDKTAGKEAINMKDMLIRFTTDVIGNCAFGINCNSLKDPDNEYVNIMTKFFVDQNMCENIKNLVCFLFPNFMLKLRFRFTKPTISEFFMRIIKETVDYREKNNIFRKDFMHLLLQLKNRGTLSDDQSIFGEGKSEDPESVALSFNELAAQAFVFFLAGFETSSTTMTFCLYELASNPDIQEKLRAEVQTVLKKNDGKITYEGIMEMQYMERVIDETLRKYPPLAVLNRICTKEYKVPGTSLVLEKGTKVMIPVYGLQHDPEYYPDPEKFDPERFSEENKKTRHPFTYLPFGEGPRICIGLRFGVMQTKVGLAALLNRYKFKISPQMRMPIEYDAKSFITSVKDGVILDYEKI